MKQSLAQIPLTAPIVIELVSLIPSFLDYLWVYQSNSCSDSKVYFLFYEI
jgi:hypothetical protein